MIKIDRSKCPPILKDSNWQDTNYNKKEVVKELWKMQKEKCCYCEQKIPEYGHLKAVEHFKPKSVFKGRTNDWKNLLLACAQCNGKKSNKFPIELTEDYGETKVIYIKKDSPKKHKSKSKNTLLINPSNPKINPEKHIDFIVDDINEELEMIGLPIAKGKSKQGIETIRVIGLDGDYYTSKRREYYLNTLQGKYHLLLTAKHLRNDDKLKDYKDYFILYMSSNNEFAGFSRSFARYRKLDKRFGIKIPCGVDV